MLTTSKGSYDLIMVNPPRTQGATLSAWKPPEVTSSAWAAQSTTSVRLSFSPHRMCARYAPPAAEAPEEPMPLHGLMPFLILISMPKSAPHLLRTSAAAMLTEFDSGSVGMESEPGPETSDMTMPEGIFLPSMMSYGSSSEIPKMSKPAPMLEVVAGAAILIHSPVIGSLVPAPPYHEILDKFAYARALSHF